MLQVETNDAKRRILEAGKSAELAAAFHCVEHVADPLAFAAYPPFHLVAPDGLDLPPRSMPYSLP